MNISGQARKRGGGAEKANPAVRLCSPLHRLHVQREAEFGYAEEKPQGHQGGTREDEVQSRRECCLLSNLDCTAKSRYGGNFGIRQSMFARVASPVFSLFQFPPLRHNVTVRCYF